MRQLPLEIQGPELSLSSSVDSTASISEIILASDSALQPVYLLPILSQMAIDQRWLMWLADESSLNRHWVSALGLDASQVLHINAEQACFHQVCCKALAAGTGHLIIEWPGAISEEELSELELSAKQGNSHALLVRRR